MNLIVACSEDFGIGLEGKLPWRCSEDLALFKKLTTDSILIMGRKTLETLPKLDKRMIFCLSKTLDLTSITNYKNSCIFAPSFDSVFQTIKFSDTEQSKRPIYIAGGGEIYKAFLESNYIKECILHVSVIKSTKHLKCDTHIDFAQNFTIKEQNDFLTFTKYTLFHDPFSGENQYLKLLREIKEKGILRIGRNGETKSLFGKTLSFDLEKGFPLLTTRKMFFRGIIEELLFFISGEIDSKKLEEKGVNIWKKNTERSFLDSLGKKERKEGILGKMYGYLWRNYGGKIEENTGSNLESGLDQLKKVIDTIKNDPFSRRILLSTYDPISADSGVLYPCHSIILQFYVGENKELSMTCYNRSSDAFLGLPWNIASSALLLHLVAKETGLKAKNFILNLGDVHIYQTHFDAISDQLRRFPFSFPNININSESIFEIKTENINLTEYRFHPAIEAEMVA